MVSCDMTPCLTSLSSFGGTMSPLTSRETGVFKFSAIRDSAEKKMKEVVSEWRPLCLIPWSPSWSPPPHPPLPPPPPHRARLPRTRPSVSVGVGPRGSGWSCCLWPLSCFPLRGPRSRARFLCFLFSFLYLVASRCAVGDVCFPCRLPFLFINTAVLPFSPTFTQAQFQFLVVACVLP